MKAPTPEELANHYENRASDFVTGLIEQYTAADPDFVAVQGDSLSFHLSNAFDDALRLDFHAEALGLEPSYLPGFMKSVFYTEGFTDALFAYSLVPLDRKTTRGFKEAIEKGKETSAPFLMMKFREFVLDGYTPSEALRHFSNELGEQLSAGNTDFVKTLANYIRDFERRPVVRSAQGWIFRAWLPLALWESVPVKERANRLRNVGSLLAKAGANLISIPANLEKLITTVESKIRKQTR